MENSCCDTGFKVEAVLTVDDRGQILLPKELREKAQLKPGDKLAVATFEQDGQFCCMCLIRTEALTSMVKTLLGPMMQEITKTGGASRDERNTSA